LKRQLIVIYTRADISIFSELYVISSTSNWSFIERLFYVSFATESIWYCERLAIGLYSVRQM
jgi:hypothetical protein